MIILPAIDLQNGKCVRLRQGKESDSTVYSDNPVEMAKQWEFGGAEYLHIVDLDGAFRGYPVHTDVIKEIVSSVNIPVEVGGGLRNLEHISNLINIGVARVILGTKAFQNKNDLIEMVRKFQDSIAVGIDAKNNKVQVSGWVETTDINAFDFAKECSDIGVSTIIFTDTSRDGMLSGVNVDAMRKMCESVDCNVIASGGVTSVEDIPALMSINKNNLIGVIVGKALYDGRVTLNELNEAVKL